MYGVALHSATDIFAHSSYTTSGNYISHTSGTNAWQGAADETAYIPSRNNCAAYMAQFVMSHANSGTEGTINDFCYVANGNNGYYTHDFYLKSYGSYAQGIDSVYYNANSSVFNTITIK